MHVYTNFQCIEMAAGRRVLIQALQPDGRLIILPNNNVPICEFENEFSSRKRALMDLNRFQCPRRDDRMRQRGHRHGTNHLKLKPLTARVSWLIHHYFLIAHHGECYMCKDNGDKGEKCKRQITIVGTGSDNSLSRTTRLGNARKGREVVRYLTLISDYISDTLTSPHRMSCTANTGMQTWGLDSNSRLLFKRIKNSTRAKLQ